MNEVKKRTWHAQWNFLSNHFNWAIVCVLSDEWKRLNDDCFIETQPRLRCIPRLSHKQHKRIQRECHFINIPVVRSLCYKWYCVWRIVAPTTVWLLDSPSVLFVDNYLLFVYGAQVNPERSVAMRIVGRLLFIACFFLSFLCVCVSVPESNRAYEGHAWFNFLFLSSEFRSAINDFHTMSRVDGYLSFLARYIYIYACTQVSFLAVVMIVHF